MFCKFKFCVVILFAFIVFSGCTNQLQNELEEFSKGMRPTEVRFNSEDDIMEYPPGECIGMVCKRNVPKEPFNIFFDFSLKKSSCSFINTNVEEFNKMQKHEKDDSVRNFMFGAGPTFISFTDANAYCNNSMKMSVKWLVGDQYKPYTMPNRKRAECFLDKNIIPVYILYSNSSNINSLQAREIATALNGAGPVIIVSESELDDSNPSNYAKVKEQIRELKANCPKCLIALGVKLNGSSEYNVTKALFKDKTDPTFKDSVDLVAYGLNSHYFSECNSDRMFFNAITYSKYVLHNYSKPSLITYVLFDTGKSLDGSCTWTKEQVADGYSQLYTYSLSLVQNGIIGASIYSFYGGGPLTSMCNDCAFVNVDSNTECDPTVFDPKPIEPRFSKFFGFCQAYYTGPGQEKFLFKVNGLTLEEITVGKKLSGVSEKKKIEFTIISIKDDEYTGNDNKKYRILEITGGVNVYGIDSKKDSLAVQLPIVFSNGSQPCSFAGNLNIGNYIRESDVEIRPSLPKNYKITKSNPFFFCSNCISTGKDPTDFSSYSPNPVFSKDKCKKYPQIEIAADNFDLDPMLLRAIVWQESDFNQCSVSYVPKSRKTCNIKNLPINEFEDYICAGCSTEKYYEAPGFENDPVTPCRSASSFTTQPDPNKECKPCAFGIAQVIEYPSKIYNNPLLYSGPISKHELATIQSCSRAGEFNPFLPYDSACAGAYELMYEKLPPARALVANNLVSLGVTGLNEEDENKKEWYAIFFALDNYFGHQKGKEQQDWIDDFAEQKDLTLEKCKEEPYKNMVKECCGNPDFLNYVKYCEHSGGFSYAYDVLEKYSILMKNCDETRCPDSTIGSKNIVEYLCNQDSMEPDCCEAAKIQIPFIGTKYSLFSMCAKLEESNPDNPGPCHSKYCTGKLLFEIENLK